MSSGPNDPTSQNVVHAFKEYKWYNSLSLPIEIQCAVCRLDLPPDMCVSSQEIPANMFITAHLICNQIPVHETPMCTHFAYGDPQRNTLIWDYIMSFPLKIRDLSHDAVLALTVWTPDGKIFGGTTMRLFDQHGVLKSGKQKLMFYFDTKADPNVVPCNNTTPGEYYDIYAPWDYKFKMEKFVATYTTSQSCSNRSRTENKQEWLDRLSLSRMQEAVNDSLLRNAAQRSKSVPPSPAAVAEDADGDADLPWGCALEEIDLESFAFLIVEMPTLQHVVRKPPVIFFFHILLLLYFY